MLIKRYRHVVMTFANNNFVYRITKDEKQNATPLAVSIFEECVK